MVVKDKSFAQTLDTLFLSLISSPLDFLLLNCTFSVILQTQHRFDLSGFAIFGEFITISAVHVFNVCFYC